MTGAETAAEKGEDPERGDQDHVAKDLGHVDLDDLRIEEEDQKIEVGDQRTEIRKRMEMLIMKLPNQNNLLRDQRKLKRMDPMVSMSRMRQMRMENIPHLLTRRKMMIRKSPSQSLVSQRSRRRMMVLQLRGITDPTKVTLLTLRMRRDLTRDMTPEIGEDLGPEAGEEDLDPEIGGDPGVETEEVAAETGEAEVEIGGAGAGIEDVIAAGREWRESVRGKEEKENTEDARRGKEKIGEEERGNVKESVKRKWPGN